MAWTVTGGVMTTSDPDALLFHGKQHATPYVVTVRVKGNAAGDQLRVLLGVNAARTSYLYVQITLASDGNGELKLSAHDGSAETTVPTTVPGLYPGMWHTIRACLNFTNGGLLVGIVTTAGGVRRSTSLPVPDAFNEDGVGLGTGDLTTEASFDSFLWQREQGTNDPDCPPCTTNCVWGTLECSGSLVAADWQIVAGAWSCGTTNSDSATLLFLPTQPDEIHHHRVHGLISSTQDGAEAIFYVRYKDASTYLAGRATFDGDCGKLEILQNGTVLDFLNVGPLTSLENPGDGTNRLHPQHFLCVAYDGTYLSAHLGPGGGQSQSLSDQYGWIYRHLRAAVTPDPDGLRVAIGTGSNPGAVTFEDVFVSTPFSLQHPYCDTCFTCVLTAGGNPDIPNQCEFVYSGMVRQTNSSPHGAWGLILSTAGSYAAYKGNIGVTDAYVVVTFVGTASGQVLRVFPNNDGDLTGPWAEIEIKNSPAETHLRLSTGAEVTTATTIQPGERHHLIICLNGASLTAMLNHGTAPEIGDESLEQPGDAVVFDTITPATGHHVTFALLGASGDLSVLSPYYARGNVPKHAGVSTWPLVCGRCSLECSCCENGAFPSDLLIEIPNIETTGYIGGNDLSDSRPGVPDTVIACGVQSVSYPSLDVSRMCTEIPGGYVLSWNGDCAYLYQAPRRIWQINDEPPGQGDDTWACWDMTLEAFICCAPTTGGVQSTCAELARLLGTPAGQFRLVVRVHVETRVDSPPPGTPPCAPTVAGEFTNVALVAVHDSLYYSEPMPFGTSCSFQDLVLTPLAFNEPNCNACGIPVVGTNGLPSGWSSNYPIFATSVSV